MTIIKPPHPEASPKPRSRIVFAAILSAPALLGATSLAASAAEPWQQAGSGAVAILPAPAKAVAITGGSLVCAEQRWSLRLRTEPRQPSSSVAQAKLMIDEMAYPVLAEQTASIVTLPVSAQMIGALKSGTKLAVEFAMDGAMAASFPLGGSRKVIEAVARLCSQVDMSAYERIEVSEADPAIERARPLLAEEIELFRTATTATPRLAAAKLDRGGGREMLFATLCGSSWYFGRSGCSLFGYLRTTPSEAWRAVFNSEGLGLYLDPNAASGGWPDLVTLERVGGVDPMRWTLTGDRYEPRDPLIAADEVPQTGTISP